MLVRALGRPVEPTLLRFVVLPPPAAGPLVFPGRGWARARCAADRGVAPVVQRVTGHVVAADVLPDLLAGPGGEGRDLRDTAVRGVFGDHRGRGPRRALVSAEPGDP